MKYGLSTVFFVLLFAGCDSTTTSQNKAKTPTAKSTTKAAKTVTPTAPAKAVATGEAKPVAKTPAGSASGEVHYYTGTYAVTSPDGKKPYGPPKQIAAKRTFQKSKNLILEVLDFPKKHFEVVLERKEGSTFHGVDQDKSWTGTIVYSGPDWHWDKWTYDIKMSDGSGTLKGNGSLVDGQLTTEKLFYDPQGKPQARILESLKLTTEAAYSAQLKAIKQAK